MTRREILERGAMGMLVAGVASLLAACASDSTTPTRSVATTKNPPRTPTSPNPKAAPMSFPQANTLPPALPGDVIPRSSWAKGSPIISRMNRADRPYTWITVHHDGMDSFTSTSYASAAARLEQIRNAHIIRKPEPFGDIGYHYLIDPSGRVWQGAHVAGENPGNLGICVMGNYDIQRPNAAQLAALNRFVAAQMRAYHIPLARVRTHQEWPSAHTRCPGFSLEQYMRVARLPGGGIAMA